jgi:hypothetical protein
MQANRAKFGSDFSNVDMTANATFPNYDVFFNEDMVSI